MRKTIIMLLPVVVFSMWGTSFAAATQPTTKPTTTSIPASTKKINLNHADATSIATAGVKGIGIKRAQAIVDYRNQHGPFKTFDDLAKVKGLGTSFVKSHLQKLSEVFVLV